MVLTNSLGSVDLTKLEVYDVTPQEAYSAFYGLGLPNEKDCGETAIKSLEGMRLKSIEAEQIRGSNRSVVYSLTLDDDTRVFLGSGPEGAIAYRLCKPRRYIDEVPSDCIED